MSKPLPDDVWAELDLVWQRYAAGEITAEQMFDLDSEIMLKFHASRSWFEKFVDWLIG